MNFEKESIKIINLQSKRYPQIKKKQEEIILNPNFYNKSNKIQLVIQKGEKICQTEMKY